MASSLPSPADCCSPCDGEASVQVPGPTGAAGTNGTNGTNGVNAFSALDGPFTMPAELSNVTVDVSDSTWMGQLDLEPTDALIGQVVFVELAGYMEVQSRPTTTSVILKNLQDVSVTSATSGLLIVGKTYTISTYAPGDDFANVGALTNATGVVFEASGTTPADWTYGSTLSGVDQGAYPDNSAPGAIITSGLQVSPGGIQGAVGDSAGNAPDSATYVTMSASPDLSAEVPVDTAPAPGTGTYGNVLENQTGTLYQRTVGVADENSVTVDDAGGLGAGEAIFGTAAGIESKPAAAARTALGLGTAAIVDTGVTDNDVVTVDQATGLATGEIAFATAAGIETKTLAAAKTYLGVGISTTTTTASTPYTLLTTDRTVLHNVDGGVLILPDATGNNGLQYSIKKIKLGTTANVITAFVPNTIDGNASYSLSGNLSGATIVCDGSDWHILSTIN